jgi:hypothetical protein
MNGYPIDFVIIWVDGGDPEWLAERNKYIPESNTDTRGCRYRDWDNLRYWFRGVEKFAPWVNNIYFVTWGHLPVWLDVNNPKLKIIKHEDYIPAEYLPTFSANPIELNLHRIKDLSEHFVYFNDDMFLLKKTKREDFFKKGKPCDSAVLTANYFIADDLFLAPAINIATINKYFNFKKVIKNNFGGWFNLKYGHKALQTLVLLKCPHAPGMWHPHLMTSLCKSTYEFLWEKEYTGLHETCLHKFRHLLDFTQWLFKDWQVFSGNFAPRRANAGKVFHLHIKDNIKRAVKYITKQKGKFICVNDNDLNPGDFEKYKTEIIKSFDKILPEKSTFEL